MLLIIGILFAFLNDVQISASKAQSEMTKSMSKNLRTTCPPTFAAFTSSGVFQVPCGVCGVTVLVVGGGSGGGSGAAGGGSAGFVKSNTVEVDPLMNVSITIGKGGAGSTRKTNNCTQDSQPGGRTAFSFLLSASGGRAHNGSCYESWRGASGGSGGGAGCNGPCRGGAGGSGGSAGSNASKGMTWGPGSGSGNFSAQLNKFIFSDLKAGAGGKGKLHVRPGGGGAGGILLNNAGPVGHDGDGEGAAEGGIGYGAGGGSGQTLVDEDDESQQVHTTGGKGADGLVYVEWSDADRRTPAVRSAEYNIKCPATSAIFTTNGEFRVPCGVSRVRVLVVGGGSGGGSGNAGGGASGFVRGGEYRVEPGSAIPITIGKGGIGSTFKINYGTQDSKPGGKTSFGYFVSAEGGGRLNGEDAPSCDFSGQPGGSGGGAGCTGPCWSGNGGFDGSRGNSSSGGNSLGNGSGQGSFASQLELFKQNVLIPGPGGNGVFLENPGGGGAGGVLVNKNGPNGTTGPNGGAYGGKGYGAGGGGGFLNRSGDGNGLLYHAGGNGADGLVYIEWWWNDGNRLLVDTSTDLQIDMKNSQQACSTGMAIFNSSGTFQVPWHVTRVRVLIVGGGQGGSSAPCTGGSSGYTAIRQFAVSPREIISITVGDGGTPSGSCNGGNAGSASALEGYQSAGGSGGSGGGQGANGGRSPPYQSGAGGSDGSRGELSSGQGTGGPNDPPSSGQGSYAGQLSVFTYNRITPGAGGSGAYGNRVGGGGGGGVLINGRGPATPAGNGDSVGGGAGGKGYGAGGGALGTSGGRGANGLVYIEW